MKCSKSVLLASSIVWAAVIIAAALALQGHDDCFGRILPLIGGGAGAHVVILGGASRKTGRGTGEGKVPR